MLDVAFIGTFAASMEPRVRAQLAVPCRVAVEPEAGIAPKLSTTDVVVTMAFTAEMGCAAARLKLVQVPGAGLDRIERAALPAGARLANVYGHENGIAEFVLGAMLALSRDFARLDASLRRGLWESQWAVGAPPTPVWRELAGKTLVILGYGRIGRALARRARAFEMTVLATRRTPGRDDHAALHAPGALADVLAAADYVAVTLPLTPDTRGLIGARELATMKPTAMLVNVSRADIVDEDALYEALAERRIAAAALDVWYRYPKGPGATLPAGRPFHELPNVLMTPHVSGWTDGMLEARAALIAENIGRVARGDVPLNLVA